MNKKAKVPKQEAKSRGHIKSGMRVRGNVPEGQEGVERARRGKGRTDRNYVFKSPPILSLERMIFRPNIKITNIH